MTDSAGICSSSAEDSSEDVMLDHLIDQQLIQLQTHAALITSTLLKRSEYITGQPDSDSAENEE